MSRYLAIVTAIGTIFALAPAAAQDGRCEPDGTALTVVAEGNEFDTTCLAVPAESDFTIELINRDPFSHNLSIYREEGGEALFTGAYVGGNQTQTYEVDGLAQGSFYFRCDIHPPMEGTFLSGDAAAQPGPSPTESEVPVEGPAVRLEAVATGLTAPVFITQPPGDDERVFIVDQPGQIRIVRDGELLEEPFLDVSGQIVELNPSYDERGLLGLAFHPDYEQNGRFFVYYSAPLRDGAPDDWDHTSHVSQFSVSGDDDERADPDSEKLIMAIDQPQSNHNAGHIAFGPDGYLYIPLGDGGAGNDVGTGHVEGGNAQAITNVLGSVLRIDVDGGDPYAVPEDNPFAGEQEGEDEIYAWGFRNPYHLSFDAETGEMYVADAGQDRYEEVSQVELGGNYGWRIREASHCFDPESPSDPPASCPSEGPNGEPLIDPVIEYGREEYQSAVVVGGYVYRGDTVSYLEGAYVFGDYSRNRLEPDGVLYAAAQLDGEGKWEIRKLGVEGQGADGELGRFVLGFGQDQDRELYVGVIEMGGPTGATGAVYRLAAAEGQEPLGGTTGDGDGGIPAWVWLVIAAVLLLIGGLTLAVRRARGGPRGTTA